MKYFVKQAIVFTTANEICYFYYYYTISIFICLLFIFIREYVNAANKTFKRLNSLLLSLWRKTDTVFMFGKVTEPVTAPRHLTDRLVSLANTDPHTMREEGRSDWFLCSGERWTRRPPS